MKLREHTIAEPKTITSTGQIGFWPAVQQRRDKLTRQMRMQIAAENKSMGLAGGIYPQNTPAFENNDINAQEMGLAGGMILVIPRTPAPAILQNHAILP